MIMGRETITALKEIASKFDVGCSIHVGDDGITIEGHDYLPTQLGLPEKLAEASHVVRTYDVRVEYDAQENYKDTLSPVVAQIAADSCQLAGHASEPSDPEVEVIVGMKEPPNETQFAMLCDTAKARFTTRKPNGFITEVVFLMKRSQADEVVSKLELLTFTEPGVLVQPPATA